MIFSSRQYSIRDFAEWHDRNELELAPKFQRRSVWDPKARSYLMDTILHGKPIPKIYMRQIVNPRTRDTVREIVDGQQRLRSVFDFLQDGFPILKVHSDNYANMHFSELDEDAQRNILQYEFTVDLLQDIPDDEVYEVFARLNTYAITLNAQELRHARHFGDFRTSVYTLSQEFLMFWATSGIFTPKNILRMIEAEYVSDLLISMTEGIRAKEKRAIDKFYRDWDEKFPNRKIAEKRFRQVMDDIGGIMEDTLPQSTLKSTRLFYSFFLAIYHMQFGLPNLDVKRIAFNPTSYPKLRNALGHIDEVITKLKAEGKVGQQGGSTLFTAEARKFYRAYAEYWVHAAERNTLTKYICKVMTKAL